MHHFLAHAHILDQQHMEVEHSSRVAPCQEHIRHQCHNIDVAQEL